MNFNYKFIISRILIIFYVCNLTHGYLNINHKYLVILKLIGCMIHTFSLVIVNIIFKTKKEKKERERRKKKEESTIMSHGFCLFETSYTFNSPTGGKGKGER